MMDDRVKASRFLAYILRHHPEDLGLELDPRGGWVPIRSLLQKLNKSGRFEDYWTEADLQALVALSGRRLVIEGERICAFNGHSVPGITSLPELRLEERRAREQRSDKAPAKGSERTRRRMSGREKRMFGTICEAEPPELLFHVTNPEMRARIVAQDGLKAAAGQLLKLTADWASAVQRARKSGGSVVVVEAARAHKEGLRFFLSDKGLFRCGDMPYRYLCSERLGFSRQRAAGCVVVRQHGPRLEFVLIRTRPRDGLRLPSAPSAERFELPKGKIEEGEQASEAALRELREETGIATPIAILSRLPSIGYVFRGPHGAPISKNVHFFLVRSEDQDPAFEPRLAEGIVGVEWHAHDEALRVIAFENLRPVLLAARALFAARAQV